MLGVADVTTVGALLSAAVRAGSASTGGTAGSGASVFGPAYLLAGVFGGGSPVQAAQGLYSSLGQALGTMNPQNVAHLKARSAADTQRRTALQAAAEKINAGDVQGGRAAAHAWIKKSPQDAGALALVGRSYVMEGEYEHAEKFYVRAAAAAPDNARIQGDLDNTRTLQKDDAEALALARRKVADPSTSQDGLRLLFDLSDRSPRNVDVHLAMADAFQTARQPLQSVLSLQKAELVADKNSVGGVVERVQAFVEEHPDIGMGHNLLGRALQKAGREREAFAELQTAHRLAPTNTAYTRDLANAYLARAQTRRESGDLHSAQADLNQARDIAGWSSAYATATARLSAALGERDLAAGRFTQALGHLNDAKSNAPDDPKFREQLARQYVRAAGYYDQGGNKSTALTSYLSAVELDSSLTRAGDRAAALSHDKGLEIKTQGDYETALTYLEKAHQLRPSNNTYRYDLAGVYDLNGVVLQAQSKIDAAIASFEKGLKLDPSNASLKAHYEAALAARGG